jgi:outer membrane protein TolC
MKLNVFTAALLCLPLWAAAQGPQNDTAYIDPTHMLGLAPRQDVGAVLQRALSYGAANEHVLAEQALRRQAASGPGEWTVTMGAARPRATDLPGSAGTDLELSLERPLRWPGKRDVQSAHAEARVASSQAQARRAWVDNARTLLSDLGGWLRESHQARILGSQVGLLRQQIDVVTRRQRLGDAAAVEVLQAHAALAQLQVQSTGADARERSARSFLQTRYPGLQLQEMAPDARPAALAWSDVQLLDLLVSGSAELELARREAVAALALSRVDGAERRADPTVALKWTRTRQGAEQSLGFAVSLPLGGDYRAAAASASAARARAAAQLAEDQQLRVRSEGQRRLADLGALRAQHQHSIEALRQLRQLVERISRGYLMGEGSLTEVLLAQRQVLDQELGAAQLGVDFSLAQAQLLLDAGQLWIAPPP